MSGKEFYPKMLKCLDMNDGIVLELGLSCDNLRCDGNGRAPNSKVTIQIMTPPQAAWVTYGKTEIIDVSHSYRCK